MPDPANEPLPTPNSEQEYWNGVADDGGELNIISEHLTPPRGNENENEEMYPPIGPHALHPSTGSGQGSRFHLEAEKKILDADRAHMERVRECVELLRDTVRLGKPARELLARQAEGALLEQELANEAMRRRLERMKNTPVDQLVEGEVGATPASPVEPDGASNEPQDESDGDDAPQTVAATCLSAEALAKVGTSPTKPRARSRATQASPLREPRAPRFSPALLLTLALRAAKDLPKLSAELRDLEAKLLPAEAELKLKQEFYLDKAVSIVTDTLVSMDEKFGKLGFGNWMPFRFLDQWLMFCGVLNRVLAAHGLMPSGHAAVYRKLLDTPSISLRSADAGPPKSWGLAYRVRELPTMKALLERIAEVQSGRGPPL